MVSPLRGAAQSLWNAIDQEYDVDDGIPNFSSDIGLAYTNLGRALKVPGTNASSSLVEALIAVRTWFQWNDAFVRDMADAECEPCNPREVIRAVLAKVEDK